MTVLALTYRPRTFDEIVGQRHIKPILKAMLAKNDLPPALLFAGTRGSGKTTTARIIAAALNCTAENGTKPCLTCNACIAVKAGNSLDVIEVDAASNGLVADIRKIKDMCSYQHGGEWRVILLDEAHSMSKEAFNALLKVLEEPPANTLFILLTTEPNKILDTVLSRCMTFEFRRHTTADIVGRLRHIADDASITAEDDMLTEIATRSQGGLRDAVMLLDQVSKVGVSTVGGYRQLFGINDASTEIFEKALQGDHNAGAKLIDQHFFSSGDASGLVNDLVLLVRDLLVLRSGGDLPSLSDADISIRQRLSTQVGTDRLVSVIKVLWDLKSRVRAIDNDQRAAMHMSFVLISEALSPSVPTQRSTATNGAGQKMTLADIQAMVK